MINAIKRIKQIDTGNQRVCDQKCESNYNIYGFNNNKILIKVGVLFFNILIKS